MNHSLRMKGLLLGRWQLEDDTILITSLLDPGVSKLKYEFEMTLALLSSSRGRWNKLTLQDYHSLNLATGEEVPIRLFNQKPFFFSRVRSYPVFA